MGQIPTSSTILADVGSDDEKGGAMTRAALDF
jgi:hypothetical protein